MSIASEGVDGLAYFAGGILGGMAGAAFVKSMGNRMNAVKEGKTVTKSMSGAGAKRGTVTRKRLSLIKRRTVQNSSVASQSKPLEFKTDLSRALGKSKFEFFAFAEIDSTVGVGGEASGGVILNPFQLSRTGVFVSGGDSYGGNIGVALGGGFVINGIDGSAVTIDVNIKAVSFTLILNEDGSFNGMAVSFGIGLGGSLSRSETVTYRLDDIFSVY